MNLELLTDINPETEALNASKARQLRVELKASTRIATRDARAHRMLKGLRPGQSVHIASMGELSLHDAAGAIAEQYGPFECLTLATWAASEGAIKRLLSLRDAGHVRRLEALVDSRMPTDMPDAHALLKLSFDRYLPGSNHAKVLAFTGPMQAGSLHHNLQAGRLHHNKCGVAVLSSANLTANPRCEFMVVCMDTRIAEFHRDWIREVLRGQ